MKRASFLMFIVWAMIAPGLVYEAAEHLTPIAAVIGGIVIGAISIGLAIWRAYRDSLPIITDEDYCED